VRSPASPAVALLGVALTATLASSAVERTRLEVQDWDCPPASASCARPVLVVGFPLPYISDHHGISVVGKVDLLGALTGEDRLHPGAFWADVGLYFLLAASAWTVARGLAERRRAARLGRNGP
jgi:hypothetical protein